MNPCTPIPISPHTAAHLPHHEHFSCFRLPVYASITMQRTLRCSSVTVFHPEQRFGTCHARFRSLQRPSCFHSQCDDTMTMNPITIDHIRTFPRRQYRYFHIAISRYVSVANPHHRDQSHVLVGYHDNATRPSPVLIIILRRNRRFIVVIVIVVVIFDSITTTSIATTSITTIIIIITITVINITDHRATTN